jgi:hypothetical protein
MIYLIAYLICGCLTLILDIYEQYTYAGIVKVSITWIITNFVVIVGWPFVMIGKFINYYCDIDEIILFTIKKK